MACEPSQFFERHQHSLPGQTGLPTHCLSRSSCIIVTQLVQTADTNDFQQQRPGAGRGTRDHPNSQLIKSECAFVDSAMTQIVTLLLKSLLNLITHNISL